MATQQQTKAPNPAPKSGSTSSMHKQFVLSKQNYQLLALGVSLIVIGFIFMSGGATTDPKVFDYNTIYSFRRVDLSTIFVIGGFVVNIFAIMYKPKAKEQQA